MRINYKTVGRVAYGAARGAYGAYRADQYGDTAQVGGDLVATILRAAGANQAGGSSAAWNAVTAGVTQAFLNQYDTITIATNATPSVTVNLRDALASGPPSPVAQWLQPTVILTGPGGQQVVAPYGVSGGSPGAIPLAVLTLLGLGYLLGRAF